EKGRGKREVAPDGVGAAGAADAAGAAAARDETTAVEESRAERTTVDRTQTGQQKEERQTARPRGATTPESLTAMRWKEEGEPALEGSKPGAGLAGVGEGAEHADGLAVQGKENEGSANRSPRPSAESRGRAATEAIDFAAVKAGGAANGSV
ncbi:hypothetical protein AOQ84DRAFT_381967, partial [Glonium stellatum]